MTKEERIKGKALEQSESKATEHGNDYYIGFIDGANYAYDNPEINNNGWIRIESEADLPEEDGLFWIVEGGVVINQPCNYSAKKWYLYAKQYPTHYQPIEKPQTPIY